MHIKNRDIGIAGNNIHNYVVFSMNFDKKTTYTGILQQRITYTPWGRRNLAEDNTNTGKFLFDRGFTGHEHLDEFGLINMNGRMYDPILGVMLSPDNYVQNPYGTQGFNRYSYAGNNPLVFTDPSGEFFGTALTFIGDLIKTAFFEGGLDPTSSTARNNAWRSFDPTAKWSPTNKAWQIDKGFVRTDKDKTLAGKSWQVISRFTPWEFPMTMVGNVTAHYHNISGNVESVEGFYGATVVNLYEDRINSQAYTIGPYITGDINSTNIEYRRDSEGNVVYNAQGMPLLTHESSLLIHEYGHYLQGRAWGSIPYLIGGINSYNYNVETHPNAWSERDASRRGLSYFSIKGYSSAGYSWGEDLERERKGIAWINLLVLILIIGI